MSLDSIKDYTLSNRQNILQNINDFVEGDIKHHIIKWYKEDDNKYKWRTNVSYYQDYISPIIDGLTGMIFSKEHVIKIKDLYNDNIDLVGTNVYKFMQVITKNAIKDGLCFIVADTNRVADTKASLNDVNNGEIRGYLKHYTYLQLVNFKLNDNGTIKQIVFKDSISIDVENNEFTTKNIDRYVRYKLGGGDIYHNINNKIVLIRSWKNDLADIPISIIYGSYDNIGLNVKSIVHKIQKLNKSHLNLKSGLMNISHIASNPTPILWGEPSNLKNGKMEIGVNSIISFPTNQGKAFDFQWREITGSSVQVAERELKALEDYIVSSSFNILRIDNFTTATEARLNFSKNKSILTSIAKSLEHGVIKAFMFLEQLTQIKILEELSINTDFDSLLISGEHIKAIIDLKNSGNISLDTLWNSLIDGEIIKIDDFEMEKEKLLDEIAKGL